MILLKFNNGIEKDLFEITPSFTVLFFNINPKTSFSLNRSTPIKIISSKIKLSFLIFY